MLLLIFFVQALGKTGADEYNTLGELVADIKAGSVAEFSVNESGKATIKTNQGITKTYTFTNLGYDYFIEHYGDILQAQHEAGTLTKLNFTPPSMATMWLSYLPYLFLIGITIIALVLFMRSSGGKGSALNNFGKARVRNGMDEKKKVLFKDVAGADEEKE